jgi:hypothetical protein
MNDTLSILIIADPQLKNEIENIIGKCAANVAVHYWQKGSSKESIELAWKMENHWGVVFSVYSDYILSPHALSKIRIPLNIHPALPNNPGVGYDVYPLIHSEKKCGATIHWMERKIDHGVVLESESVPLPQRATYPITRKLNQTAVLSLFEKWFRLASKASKQALFERLTVPVSQGRGWTGPCISERMRRARLSEFRQKNPLKWDHLKIPFSLYSIK